MDEALAIYEHATLPVWQAQPADWQDPDLQRAMREAFTRCARGVSVEDNDTITIHGLDELGAACVLEMANSQEPADVLQDYFRLALQQGYQDGWSDGYAQAADDAVTKQNQIDHPEDAAEGYGAGV